MKIIFAKLFLVFFLFATPIYIVEAQGLKNLMGNNEKDIKPVSWTSKAQKISDNEYKLIFTATASPKWHFYSQYSEGTMPMAFYFDDIKGYALIGKVIESPKPKEEYDELLKGMTKYWDSKATFTQKIKITSTKASNAHGSIEYQACINGACTALTYNFKFDLEGAKNGENNFSENPVDNSMNDSDTTAAKANDKDNFQDSAIDKPEANLNNGAWEKMLWEPVIEELKAYGNENSISNKSFLVIFFLGFIGGLIALMTPCVWPMIPMTVSFFIKKDKAKGKKDAIIYGLSIVVIYVLVGLGVTGIFGADALNALATSAIFNLIFFVLLLVFAISFLGAFEIQLPTKWTNKMDQKADTTSGLISIFFMAFTLVLVSFSCTGPIIGTLLVETVTKGIWVPAIGMTGFSIALALPFTLFAIFPSMMKSMPKSGGWLNSVKVVLGFLELALALKFLSVADMTYHWHLLDREVFLVLWIVIFALLGLYLLGKLNFSHDTKIEKIGVFRLFLSTISLAFALYMIPGLWGAPLKAISAFSPPINTQDFNLYDGTVEAKFDNYEEGMSYAKAHNKPVLIDFTGWGCVNCRNMELAVWSDPMVKEILEEKYVLISLYVDDKTPLSKDKIHVSTFSNNKIRNIGNLWSDLQISKFGQSSQPYYFAIDFNGKPLTAPIAYELNVKSYKEFLDKGLKEFSKRFGDSK